MKFRLLFVLVATVLNSFALADGSNNSPRISEVLLMCTTETSQFAASKEDGSPFFVYGTFEQDKDKINEYRERFEKSRQELMDSYRDNRAFGDVIQEMREDYVVPSLLWITAAAGLSFGVYSFAGMSGEFSWAILFFALPGPAFVALLDYMVPKFGMGRPVKSPDVDISNFTYFSASLYEDVVATACGTRSNAYILKAKPHGFDRLFHVSFRKRPPHDEI